MNETTLQIRWRELMEVKMKNIKTMNQLEKSDPNIENIMRNLRELYKHKLDTVDVDTLLRIGGELLGNYASVGVTSSIKRSERDASEQVYDEMLTGLTMINKNDEVGITEARTIAKDQLSEFTNDIIWRDQAKNAYEAITEATEKTLSFIQSAIKVKTNEKINNYKLANEV